MFLSKQMVEDALPENLRKLFDEPNLGLSNFKKNINNLN